MILYIITLAFVKASTLLLIARLAVARAHQLMIRVLSVVVALWMVASVVALAFECQLPDPWNYSGGKCFDVVRVTIDLT